MPLDGSNTIPLSQMVCKDWQLSTAMNVGEGPGWSEDMEGSI